MITLHTSIKVLVFYGKQGVVAMWVTKKNEYSQPITELCNTIGMCDTGIYIYIDILILITCL